MSKHIIEESSFLQLVGVHSSPRGHSPMAIFREIQYGGRFVQIRCEDLQEREMQLRASGVNPSETMAAIEDSMHFRFEGI